MSLDSDVRIDCWPANMDSQLVSHDFRHHLTSAREHVRSHGGNNFDATIWDAFLFRPRWMLVHSKFKLLLNCRSTDVRRELIQQKISYGMMHLIYNKRMKKNRNHQSLENTFYSSVEAFFKSPGLKCELQVVFQKHQSLPFFKVVKSGCLKLLRNPLQLLDYVRHTVLALLLLWILFCRHIAHHIVKFVLSSNHFQAVLYCKNFTTENDIALALYTLTLRWREKMRKVF